MNRLNKFGWIVSAAVLTALLPARAAYSPNDLVLGFDIGTGGSSDYVINLGNFQTSVGVGSGSVVDLSGYFNAGTFNSLYGSLSSGVTMSVVGGSGATAGRDLFATVLRNGGGYGGVSRSTAPDATLSGFMANGANDVGAMSGPSGLNLSAGQSTVVPQNDPSSFQTWVLSTVPPSYFSATGIDPRGAGSPALYEDLYQAQNGVNGNQFQYLGYFSLDPNGAQTLTFTAVPEPSTAALIAIGAVAGLYLRRGKRF
jgi:hypothetical protein